MILPYGFRRLCLAERAPKTTLSAIMSIIAL